MEYIKIVGWETFQHYKKRNPPWIKLYTSLLDNEMFECLHNDSKVLLICLWLFASRKGDDEIPANLNYLQRKLPVGKKVRLQPLIDAGFIELYHNDSIVQATNDSEMLALDRDRGRDKAETEQRQKSLSIFDEARKLYKGTKRGLETEFENFTKKHKDWLEVLPLLKPAIEQQILWRGKIDRDVWWKNFKTWINNRCWEDEVEKANAPSKPPARKCACGCGKEATETVGNQHFYSAEHRKKILNW